MFTCWPPFPPSNISSSHPGKITISSWLTAKLGGFRGTMTMACVLNALRLANFAPREARLIRESSHWPLAEWLGAHVSAWVISVEATFSERVHCVIACKMRLPFSPSERQRLKEIPSRALPRVQWLLLSAPSARRDAMLPGGFTYCRPSHFRRPKPRLDNGH